MRLPQPRWNSTRDACGRPRYEADELWLYDRHALRVQLQVAGNDDASPQVLARIKYPRALLHFEIRYTINLELEMTAFNACHLSREGHAVKPEDRKSSWEGWLLPRVAMAGTLHKKFKQMRTLVEFNGHNVLSDSGACSSSTPSSTAEITSLGSSYLRDQV